MCPKDGLKARRPVRKTTKRLSSTQPRKEAGREGCLAGEGGALSAHDPEDTECPRPVLCLWSPQESSRRLGNARRRQQLTAEDPAAPHLSQSGPGSESDRLISKRRIRIPASGRAHGDSTGTARGQRHRAHDTPGAWRDSSNHKSSPWMKAGVRHTAPRTPGSCGPGTT